MPRFSTASKTRLDTCHQDIQTILLDVIEHYDFTVLCGHRGQEEQEWAVKNGRSKLHWPDSKHNRWPSEAVDIAPWPLDWSDTFAFTLLAGWVLCTANLMFQDGRITHRVRWGGDWSGSRRKQTGFIDMPHFELIT